MNDSTLDSPEAIKSFMAGAGKTTLSVPKSSRLNWMSQVLTRTRYHHLGKKEKSIVRTYLLRITGFSRAQLTRHIGRHRQTGRLQKAESSKSHFKTFYTREDILLLAQTDEAHQTLSGGITKALFRRAYEIYGDEAYSRLSKISVSHIYNLRKTKTYRIQRRHFSETKSVVRNIGRRKKPQPNGQPGFIRIDTVHQGDQDKQKGVYHINAVDEVTQFEIVASVEKISENHLIPILEMILESFPFIIQNFHSDCGSEYINHRVVEMLNKLNIEQSKSRARHCNDNALAESKNGSIIRKYFGYLYVAQKWAPRINEFNRDYLNPYLNFHRPCFFSKTMTDKKGKQKKTYPHDNVMTPYERLKQLDGVAQYLKPGITFDELDHVVMQMSDFEAAQALQKAQRALFREIID